MSKQGHNNIVTLHWEIKTNPEVHIKANQSDIV